MTVIAAEKNIAATRLHAAFGALRIDDRVSQTMHALGAEYVFRVLPRGTHRWSQFVRPAELQAAAWSSGLIFIDLRGVRYLTMLDRAAWVRSTSVNYIAAFARPA
jgi:2-polyprenyl-6-hydroxyphenyl methylase/3-demethylubiquinone-9 3-methyltransferase